ncbi:hypothetical protein LPJ57_005323, partial [Coemansia sp. RSA 486]
NASADALVVGGFRKDRRSRPPFTATVQGVFPCGASHRLSGTFYCWPMCFRQAGGHHAAPCFPFSALGSQSPTKQYLLTHGGWFQPSMPASKPATAQPFGARKHGSRGQDSRESRNRAQRPARCTQHSTRRTEQVVGVRVRLAITGLQKTYEGLTRVDRNSDQEGWRDGR